MKMTEGSPAMSLMPVRYFSSFSRRAVVLSRSALGRRSHSSLSMISSHSRSFWTRWRIVCMFVSMPPSQRWFT